MAACREYDELLTLHAAEALEPEEEARVRTHLRSCAACRAEAEAHHAVLGRVALPPPSPREQALLSALPRTVVGAWRREQVTRPAWIWPAGALLAAAAGVLLALGATVPRPTDSHAPSETAEALPLTSSEEASSALEQWAMEDPLAEALAEGAEGPASELEDFLSYP
jgi:anti-sigma factor RsiW